MNVTLPDPNGLPVEIRCLCEAVKISIGGHDPAALAGLLAGPVDEAGLLAVATWHRLDNLLGATLNGPLAENLSRDFRGLLRERVKSNVRHGLQLTNKLVEAARLLEGEGIAFLPVKGPVLASQAYQDPGLRRFRDLDLMVRPGDVARVIGLLNQHMGCRERTPLSPGQRAVALDTLYDIELTYPDGATLELHWRLDAIAERFPLLSLDDLFARAESRPVLKYELPAFPTNDLIPYLCFHGTKHLWFRLFWLVDLYALRRRTELDWSAIVGRAEQLGQDRELALAMMLCRQLFDDPIPQPVAAIAHRDAGVGKCTAYLWHFLFERKITRGYRIDISQTRKLAWAWRTQRGFGRKLRIHARYFFKPRVEDMRLLRLPRSLWWIYALVRPFRLLLGELRGRSRPAQKPAIKKGQDSTRQ